MKISKVDSRNRIRRRIRKKVSGTPTVPRLSVYRSNKAIYAQLIDDVNAVTIAAASSQEEKVTSTGTKSDQAKAVGLLIGERAKSKKVENVVFDRSGYLYHGRVKALADGAREAGLNF